MDPQPSRDAVRYDFATGAVDVDAAVLEKMKAALFQYFSRPDATFPAQYRELRESFRDGVKQSAVRIRNGAGHVGSWTLENRSGKPTLVLNPPPTDREPRYTFLAVLAPSGAGWEVSSFEHERDFDKD
jgi:hypothetical protein